MKTRVLLLGAAGQLGIEIYLELFRLKDVNLLALSSPRTPFNIGQKLDLTDTSSLREVLRNFMPHLIINASAYTDVRSAEDTGEGAEKAAAMNMRLPALLAKFCKKHGSALIHFSTDYVYGDKTTKPMKEDEDPLPLNYYGYTKLSGDREILESGCVATIFRTSWVYSSFGKNFVRSILSRSDLNTPHSVIADKYGSPTSTKTLALAVMEHIGTSPSCTLENSMRLSGLFHLTDNGFMSWADFARKIISTSEQLSFPFRNKEVVSLYDMTEFPNRPKNSRLDCSYFDSHYETIRPSVEDSLFSVLMQIASVKTTFFFK